MLYLIMAVMVWSFSFSLVGVYLINQVDDYAAILIRCLFAMLVFIPLLFKYKTPLKLKFLLALIGAIEIGLMYICYFKALHYLSVQQFISFTLTTPFYVVVLDAIVKRKFSLAAHLFAALSVFICYTIWLKFPWNSTISWGFLFTQLSNLCFAIGQVLYRGLPKWVPASQRHTTTQEKMAHFAWFYVGASFIAFIGLLSDGNAHRLPNTFFQWSLLAGLGIVASGICYFLWNEGAQRVNAGALAIVNELLKPLGFLVNYLFWPSAIPLTQLCITLLLMCVLLSINYAFYRFQNDKPPKTAKIARLTLE